MDTQTHSSLLCGRDGRHYGVELIYVQYQDRYSPRKTKFSKWVSFKNFDIRKLFVIYIYIRLVDIIYISWLSPYQCRTWPNERQLIELVIPFRHYEVSCTWYKTKECRLKKILWKVVQFFPSLVKCHCNHL